MQYNNSAGNDISSSRVDPIFLRVFTGGKKPKKIKDSKKLKKIDLTHWSSYEDWDPYRNYVIAKKFCNLQESSSNNIGTFTNFAQNDQALVALHTYMMFLKFGFYIMLFFMRLYRY